MILPNTYFLNNELTPDIGGLSGTQILHLRNIIDDLKQIINR